MDEVNIKKDDYIPFVEKYRANNFDDIILDPINKKILINIINTSYFPNLLFYGPPGTGKTTTIINLINSYQKKLGYQNKGLVIHLNASDERGIEIIRNQINQFVSSDTLFEKGIKFVILDEVDSMTKNAQQALRYLLQLHSNSVRFCLICNYISRIDEGLQNELIKLKFNKLPEDKIKQFLQNIITKEKIILTDENLEQIQKLYVSDIRSMINFIQSVQHINVYNKLYILDKTVLELLYSKISQKISIDLLINIINSICVKYNIDKKNLINCFLNYIIATKSEVITSDFMDFIEISVHTNYNSHNYINYTLSKLLELL